MLGYFSIEVKKINIFVECRQVGCRKTKRKTTTTIQETDLLRLHKVENEVFNTY